MEIEKSKLIRQDLVDNSIYNLLQELNPSAINIEWNIEIIGKIRDIIADVYINYLEICNEESFYPEIE